jgi:hypothetical protein
MEFGIRKSIFVFFPKHFIVLFFLLFATDERKKKKKKKKDMKQIQSLFVCFDSMIGKKWSNKKNTHTHTYVYIYAFSLRITTRSQKKIQGRK